MKKTLFLLAMSVLSMGAMAQNGYDTLRTNTWSFYGQGGVSFSTGGDMLKNTNHARGTEVAPFVGGGLNYNIRPWVRLGLNYAFSKYQREQRLAELEADGTTYRDQRMLYHDVDLTGEFNILELWPSRQNKRLNIYLGTGFGWMFTKGTAYNVRVGATETNKSTATRDEVVYDVWLQGHNEHSYGNSAYIPARLNIEYDLSPRWTIGAKGECNFLLKKRDYLPAQTELAGVLVRYNFVKFSMKKKYQELQNKYNALQDENNSLNDQTNRLRDELNNAKNENANLQKQLDDCQNSKSSEPEQKLTLHQDIFFNLGSTKISQQESQKVKEIVNFLNEHPDAKVSLTGYADAGTGSQKANARISDRRSKKVAQELISAGISESRITVDSKGDTEQPFPENDLNRVAVLVVE